MTAARLLPPGPVPVPVTPARVAPHDVGAEEAVLAAMLLEPDAVDEVSGLLEPGQFYVEANRWVCEAAYDLKAHGLTPDTVSVASWLRDRDRLQHCGGSAYLAHLVDAVPAVARVSDYARMVAKKAAVRRVIATCQRIAAEGYGEDGAVDGFVDGAARALRMIADDAERGLAQRDVYTERDIFRALADDLVKQVPVRTCTTGIPDLDVDIGGHIAGMVTWFGAETNWGKSSIAVMTYEEATLSGKRVLVIAAEDARELYARRLLARRAHLNAFRLRQRLIPNGDEFDRMLRAVEAARDVPFFVNAIGAPVEQIAARIKLICRAEPIDLVMVDYLQAIGTRKEFRERRLEMAHVARVLTDAVKTIDRPGTGTPSGLFFSQIKRIEGRAPTMKDLKESGDIENMAENVLIGFVRDDGARAIRVAKAKDATKEDYLLTWDTTYCGFRGGKRIERT
jgi:replicative DNA helicase